MDRRHSNPVSGSFPSPKGGVRRQPRATPWVWGPQCFQALKGRHPSPGHGWLGRLVELRPFRARISVGRGPRALPWAFTLRPVGARLAHNLDPSHTRATLRDTLRLTCHRLAMPYPFPQQSNSSQHSLVNCLDATPLPSSTCSVRRPTSDLRRLAITAEKPGKKALVRLEGQARFASSISNHNKIDRRHSHLNSPHPSQTTTR